jgi:hypothetical protein
MSAAPKARQIAARSLRRHLLAPMMIRAVIAAVPVATAFCTAARRFGSE